jgi:hypothetical protein
MHRWEVDSTRNFAEHLRVSTISLYPSSTHPQAANQRRWNDPNLMIVAQSKVRNMKSLGTSLEYHPTVRLTLEEGLERPGRHLLLQQNLAVAGSNAKLRFPSAKIDCNMLHGRLSFAAP